MGLLLRALLQERFCEPSSNLCLRHRFQKLRSCRICKAVKIHQVNLEISLARALDRACLPRRSLRKLNLQQQVVLYRGVENVKGQIIALLIWKKEGGYGALGASYKPNHEPCLLWKTKGANLNFIGDTTENRIWEIKKDGKNKLHPTQKPIEIPARAIGNHKADKVLDLFCGSGSTMVAAHQLKRKCYGMELDPKYCQVIVDRMKKLDPTLVIKRNGQTV